MADVFVSYKTESTLDLVANTIVPAIEAAGFHCWYAKRDSKHGIYGGNIKRAIGECRVFLLVLDQAALHAVHIKSETALAFRRLKNHEDITLVPFRIDKCNIQEDDDLDYYLICQQIVEGCPLDTEQIADLVETISEILTASS